MTYWVTVTAKNIPALTSCPYCHIPTVDTVTPDAEIHHRCACGWFAITKESPCPATPSEPSSAPSSA